MQTYALRGSIYPRAAHTLLPARIALLAGLIALAGCGGGGGGSSNTNPPPPVTNAVSGRVTDISGAPIVGASVTLGGQTVTTTQLGTYVVPNVTVPAGQQFLLATVTAGKTINNRPWSGQNPVEVVPSFPNTSNINVVLSDTAQQGAITGVVTDAQGHGLADARVFASLPNSGNNFFTNPSSLVAITGADGSYTIPDVPPLNKYTVIASLAGYGNPNAVTINVSPGVPTAGVSFSLSPSAYVQPPVVDAANTTVSVFTYPAVPTRAAVNLSSNRLLNVMRNLLLRQHGLLNHHSAATAAIQQSRSPSRVAPSGSLIEADLFWDYATVPNLFGYDILRSPVDQNHFATIALVRDPLATRYDDLDSVLTPDTTYYYNLARLDTIESYQDITKEGPPISPNTAVFPVTPLGPISITGPSSGATVTGSPTFSWTAVNRALNYTVFVYDRFPDLQSDTDPNGAPVFASLSATGLNAAYQGPALQSGHTYYWFVVAADNANASQVVASSFSPIQTFTTH